LKSETTTCPPARYRLEKFNDDHRKEENVVEGLRKRENHKAERGELIYEDENGERSNREGRGGYLQGMVGAIGANSGDLRARRGAATCIREQFGGR
jgi:hypothetical protein